MSKKKDIFIPLADILVTYKIPATPSNKAKLHNFLERKILKGELLYKKDFKKEIIPINTKGFMGNKKQYLKSVNVYLVDSLNKYLDYFLKLKNKSKQEEL